MLAENYKGNNLVEQLREKFDVLLPPATDSDFQQLTASIEEYDKVRAVGIPDDLKLLWKVSSEWHLIKDHYNVFGFNIYSPRQIVSVTKDVFGSEEIRQEWDADISGSAAGCSQESCGSAGWMCVASYSEYDYIFMNFNRSSSAFGATRHMVNNTNEDEALTDPPSSNFIQYALTYIDSYQENDETEQ